MRIRTFATVLTLSALILVYGGCSKSRSRGGHTASAAGGGGTTLVLTPETGEPGTSVEASGGGFGDGACTVELFWDSVDGPSLGTATVQDGKISLQITIPPDAQFGDHVIIAKGSEDCAPAAKAKTTAIFNVPIAQPLTGPFDRTIRLKDRIVVPEAGVDPEILKEIKESDRPATHLLVQLQSLPRKFRRELVDGVVREVPANDLAALKDLGITVLEYINAMDGPGTTYLASVSKEVKDEDPRFTELVRAMVRLQAGDKVEPGLSEGQPADEPVGVLIVFFADVSQDSAKAFLDGKGIDGGTLRAAPGLWQAAATSAQVQALAGEDAVEWIEAGPAPFLPTVDGAREASGIDDVQDLNASSGVYLGLTGTGVRIGILDDGVDQHHQDLASRVLRIQHPGGDHGTAVAAVAAGSGVRSVGLDDTGKPNDGTPFQWRGVAPEAGIAAFGPALGQASIHAEALRTFGVQVTNHSYALGVLGLYGADVASVDAIARGDASGIPARPAVWAAGNNADVRSRDCDGNGTPDGKFPQYPAGCPEAYVAGYFSILSPAKNVLCVGSVERTTLLHSPFSSLGPTLDGRLKPDLCAVGHPLITARGDTDEAGQPIPGNGYQRFEGTSLAAPVVTGTIALLLEKFRDGLGVDLDRAPPLPSTLKAILIHTAKDLSDTDPTVNPDTKGAVAYGAGPDWATGYGLVDAKAAMEFVGGRRFAEGEVTVAEPSREYVVAVSPDQKVLKLTLAWEDPAASTVGNETVPKLVNDLDLLVMASDGTVHRPLVLPRLSPVDCDGDPANGIQVGTCAGIDAADGDYKGPATEGVDRRNNVEQVVVEGPAPGIYRVRVSALHEDGVSVRLPLEGAQKYSLAGVTAQRAELRIAKTGDPDPVVAGEALLYTLQVTNSGPDVATEVIVVDTLPSGVRYVTDTDSGVEGPPGIITCRLGNLGVGEKREFSIRVAVDPDVVAAVGKPTTIVNRAKVFGALPEEDVSDNQAETRTIVEDRADLRVTKMTKPDRPLKAGDTGTCTIFVDNLGPSTARDVQLTDTILSDGSFTIASVKTSQGTTEPAAGGVIRCKLGDLQPASATQSGRATVTVEVTATDAMDINDLATVASPTPDPDASNNRAEASLSVKAAADLELKMQVSPDPVIAGESVTYTLTLTNKGPSEADDVKVEDILPGGVAIDSIEATDGGSWTAGVPGDPSRPTVFAFGQVASSASRKITIRADVPPDARGVLRNDARASSPTLDGDGSNNLASVATGIEAKADIAVTKAAVPEPVVAGTRMTYSIGVANRGPSTARRVRLSDELPAVMSFQGSSTSGGQGTVVLVDGPPRTVAGELGDLAPGESMAVSVTVLVSPSVPDGTTLKNAATATAAEADPDRSNNSASATTNVVARADLQVTIGTLRDTGNPSLTFVFTVTVTNGGPSDAQEVVVYDALPQVRGVDYVFDNGGGSYDSISKIVTFDVGVLRAGVQKSFDIYVRSHGSKGVLTDSAHVMSATVDPDMSNNSATREILVKGGVKT